MTLVPPRLLLSSDNSRMYSRGVKSLVIRYIEGYSLAETANRAESGQLQFWSEPSEILNLRSSNTPETVAFNIPQGLKKCDTP